MRIVHLSDVHIGVESYGRPATEADVEALPPWFAPGERRSAYVGLSTRLLDFLAVLDEAVEFATAQGADLVLFAGDAYRSRDPSQTHQREFARRVATLASRGIPVFLLTGNHDVAHSPARATALEIFPTLGVPRVHVADRLGTWLVETPSGPLQVVALPWVRRGSLLARPEQRGATIEELARQVEDQIAARLQGEGERLDPSLPAILVGHVTVAGAITSSERSMMLGRDYVLQRSSVALPCFDYVALGHVHRHQCLGQDPPVVYSGSLERVDFSEEQDVKGFCLVEVDPSLPRGRRARWSFVPTSARPFVTIEAKVAGRPDDPTAAVLEAIASRQVAGAVVRVHVTMPAELAPRLSVRAIRDALAGAHSVAGIARSVVQERPVRLGHGAQGLPPEEALRRYLASRDGLDGEARERALQWGTELIQEEMGREGP